MQWEGLSGAIGKSVVKQSQIAERNMVSTNSTNFYTNLQWSINEMQSTKGQLGKSDFILVKLQVSWILMESLGSYRIQRSYLNGIPNQHPLRFHAWWLLGCAGDEIKNIWFCQLSSVMVEKYPLFVKTICHLNINNQGIEKDLSRHKCLD